MTWIRSGSMPGSLAQDVRRRTRESATSASIRSQQAGGTRRAALLSPRLSAKQAVRGLHQRAAARQQAGVEAGERQPLEVDQVGMPRARAAEAQHVGEVLRGAQRPAQRRLRRRRAERR